MAEKFSIVIDPVVIDAPDILHLLHGEKCVKGRIAIGEFWENFYAPVEFWDVDDYVAQWREGLDRFIAGEELTCLVTRMRDVSRGGIIDTWPIYQNGDRAVFHNQIMFCSHIRDRFASKNFYDFVNPWESVTDEGQAVSQWEVARTALEDFRKTL